MNTYIPVDKLIAEIERQINGAIYDMASSNTHQVEKGAVRRNLKEKEDESK